MEISNVKALRELYGKNPSLTHSIVFDVTRFQKVTNPADRIYRILGLMDDPIREYIPAFNQPEYPTMYRSNSLVLKWDKTLILLHYLKNGLPTYCPGVRIFIRDISVNLSVH
jgi:hypothetical protein